MIDYTLISELKALCYRSETPYVTVSTDFLNKLINEYQKTYDELTKGQYKIAELTQDTQQKEQYIIYLGETAYKNQKLNEKRLEDMTNKFIRYKYRVHEFVKKYATYFTSIENTYNKNNRHIWEDLINEN